MTEPTQAPTPQYKSRTFERIRAMIGEAADRLAGACANCPCAYWRVVGGRESQLRPDGQIAKPNGLQPWTLAAFCRPLHRQTVELVPDFAAATGSAGSAQPKLKWHATGEIVTLCDAKELELIQLAQELQQNEDEEEF